MRDLALAVVCAASLFGGRETAHALPLHPHPLHPRAQCRPLRMLRSSAAPSSSHTRLDLSAAACVSTVLSKAHQSPWYVWGMLSAASSFGLASEATTAGAALSSPLVTMFTCMVLCNTGLLPPSSSNYNIVLAYLVPLAIPLLLLDADMKKVAKSSGRLLKAFIVGSFGTLFGTLVAYKIVPMSKIVGSNKIAAALCARHIGGAINFVAVSDILQTSPELIAAAMAADNVVVALYFAFLFAITSSDTTSNYKPETVDRELAHRQPSPVNLTTLSHALTLSFMINLLAQLLRHMFGISPILSVSLIAVAIATAFPVNMQSISQAGGAIGVIFMQLFFSVTGAMGHIPSVIKVAPSVFVHTTVQIVVHFMFTFVVGRLLKIPLNEIALASNANVGGPTTAAAMATSKNWKALVLPALLTGVFGYSIATGLGLLVYRFL